MTDDRPARSRSIPPARILRIDDPQVDDLSSSTTVQERVAMVAVLSRRMWEITGQPWPSYSRSEIPVTLARPE